MKKIILSILLPEQLTAITQRVLIFMAGFVAPFPALKAAYDHVIFNLDDLEKSLSRDKKSRYTLQLLEKDAKRDNAFLAFRDFIKTCMRDTEDNFRDMGNQTMEVIKRHGYTMYSLPYVENTDALKRLIKELKKPSNMEMITAMGATRYFHNMENAASEFEKLRKEKVDEESELNYKQIRQAYYALSTNLKKLVYFLDLLDEAGFNPELPEIMSSIEMEITDAMAISKGRGTRKDNKKETAA
jgi:hypothetical protein